MKKEIIINEITKAFIKKYFKDTKSVNFHWVQDKVDTVFYSICRKT